MIQHYNNDDTPYELPSRPENPMAAILESPHALSTLEDSCFLPSLATPKSVEHDTVEFTMEDLGSSKYTPLTFYYSSSHERRDDVQPDSPDLIGFTFEMKSTLQSLQGPSQDIHSNETLIPTPAHNYEPFNAQTTCSSDFVDTVPFSPKSSPSKDTTSSSGSPNNDDPSNVHGDQVPITSCGRLSTCSKLQGFYPYQEVSSAKYNITEDAAGLSESTPNIQGKYFDSATNWCLFIPGTNERPV